MYTLGEDSHETIAELAFTYNLPPYTVQRRLSKGCSTEEDIKPVYKRSDTAKKKKVVYNGEEFPSKNAFCKDLGIKGQH